MPNAETTTTKASNSRRAAWQAWVPIVALPAAAVWFVPPDWPRWAFMWLLAFAIFVGCKSLTWQSSRAVAAPWWLHVGYLLAWPGLDADAFLQRRPAPPPDRPSPGEWLFAAGKLAAGVLLLWLAGGWLPHGQTYLAGWLAMIGMILVLHFGLFHLLSCAWRRGGIQAQPLMDWPLASHSVSQFWGRRWNTAFRDLTHRFLFRPLSAKLGAKGALAAGFVFSGLVHDLVISLPAGGGYGGPTLFFLWQGGAIFAERSQTGRAIGLGRGWRGWTFTLLALLPPVCLLFHPPFVFNIVVPFLRVLAPGG
ncbi:MAG: MBOAT family protein [Pirellulales bacterium]